MRAHSGRFFFFFNDTATTEIYTLSLHDALPISQLDDSIMAPTGDDRFPGVKGDRINRAIMAVERLLAIDRKSTRLNSSHGYISYAVFCLKKKKLIPCRV